MDGSLGAKIGEGATADVHAWAPGQVVKLLKPGVPGRIGAHEARMTRAVFEAGAAAPRVFGEVTVDGRPGIVMTRLEGPTLTQDIKARSVTYEEAGAILAAAIHSVHAAPPPPDVPSLRDTLTASLRRAPAVLSGRAVAGIRALLDRLPPGDGLCHGDPNSGNVIVTANGPALIDWVAAVRAPAAFDLASAQVLLTELAPSVADDPERPRTVNAAMQAAYAARAGMSPDGLAAAVRPYLPLVRALVVLGGALPAHRESLAQRMEAEFAA